jgi:hypothetical protein
VADSITVVNTASVQFLLNPPIFRGIQIVTQSMTSGTLTAITFTSSAYDTYSGHSNVTNPSRYTAVVSGYYTVSGVVAFAASSSGSRQATIVVNGSNINGATGFISSTPSTDVAAVVSPTLDVFLNVGDFVELWAAQDSGGSLSTSVTSPITSSLWVRYSHQ